MTIENNVERHFSGHPLFDVLVARGCDPDSFNMAFAHFTTKYPGADFAEAVTSLAAEPTPVRRMARAVELFGRRADQIVAFATPADS